MNQSGDVAQLVRALPCHGRGRGFEPRRPRHSFQKTYGMIRPQKTTNLNFAILSATSLVGAPCFSRGEQRFSVAQRSWTLIVRFSAGLENSGLKCLRENPKEKQQVPPLRFATVGMTLLVWVTNIPILKRSVIPTGAKRSGRTCCSSSAASNLNGSATLPFVISTEA
jgi:hypothetical protein